MENESHELLGCERGSLAVSNPHDNPTCSYAELNSLFFRVVSVFTADDFSVVVRSHQGYFQFKDAA